MATKTKEIKKSTKSTKAVKKTTKKTVKPDFAIDINNATGAGDIYAALGWAKIDKYLTGSEINAVLSEIQDELSPRIVVCNCTKCTCCKKPNIFKRFWNWLTRKK